MSYFDNITDYQDIADWRDAYRERTDNNIPLQLCHEMTKLMKQHDLSFAELAELISAKGDFAAAREYLISEEKV